MTIVSVLRCPSFLSFEVEDYHQQLILSEKEMDNCRTRDELTGTRSSAAPLHGHKSAVTPPCELITHTVHEFFLTHFLFLLLFDNVCNDP